MAHLFFKNGFEEAKDDLAGNMLEPYRNFNEVSLDVLNVLLAPVLTELRVSGHFIFGLIKVAIHLITAVKDLIFLNFAEAVEQLTEAKDCVIDASLMMIYCSVSPFISLCSLFSRTIASIIDYGAADNQDDEPEELIYHF